ncbi:MAG TPA: phasin [Asticcacaulis sp.]|nr:phasin [Asticcacaulis sp.]
MGEASSPFGKSPFSEDGPFGNPLRMMGAQQQLAARSLVNLIEMISTTSHRYAEETAAFTHDALDLMREASVTRDPSALAELQQKWAQTCLKYSQDQTRATMAFVEQCGKQALSTAANGTEPETAEAPAPKARARTKGKD